MHSDNDGKLEILYPTLFIMLLTAKCNPRLLVTEIATLYRRYGLKESFECTGKIWGVRKQRVEQMHNSGLKKLRTSLQIKARLR